MTISLDLFALNPPQRQAVLHDDGPMLVLAGAGSGKTRVIIYRIARLMLDGVPPERILAVTFTNKAAHEMRGRLTALTGKAGRKVTLSTFHALGLSILKEEHAALGLAKNFAIYDTADQLSLTRELMRQVQVADRRLDAQRVLDIMLETKRKGLDEVQLDWGDDYELAALDLYPRYVEQMRAFAAIDFDDLILLSNRVLRTLRSRAAGLGVSSTCWWTSFKIPAPIKSSCCGPCARGNTTSLPWAMTTRPSTAGAALPWTTSSPLPNSSPAPKRWCWIKITAPPATSSMPPMRSSPKTPPAAPKHCGAPSATASRCRWCRVPPARQRAPLWRSRSRRCATRASLWATSPCCTAPMPRAGPSRRSCLRAAFQCGCWGARRCSTAKRCATAWRLCSCCTMATTRWRCGA